MTDSPTSHDPLNALAEEFAERYRRGERPPLSEYTNRHPELADEIRELFPALVMMEDLGSVAGEPMGPAPSQVPAELGDFRILREIGRGGMGVVYEAVQESLGRHVALKILPASFRMDPSHLERFRREARAAARLHHTNIVPVFGVGEHEGVHYYAMQYIQGQSLDEVITEVKRVRRQEASPNSAPSAALNRSVAQALVTGHFSQFPTTGDSGEQGGANARTFIPAQEKEQRANELDGPDRRSSTDNLRRSSTADSTSSSGMSRQSELQYFHSVARVGVQIADALEYAHNQGILHRDIKPSNLLLDLRGTVWLTDFGLAKAEDSGELTSAGDIVGTLRFMAPERLEGRSEPRSDIYALGVTLYEMLTLRPAFQDSQRGRLIERIRQEEPTRPRALDVRIPADLETVILKASAKNPTDRYTTAQELADDLKRFLLDEPIRAKRPTLLQRARKWSRRHQAVVVTAAIGSLAAVIVLVASVGWVLWDKATRRATTMQEAGAALDEAKRHQLQARWPEALAAARRAEGSLTTGESNLEIRADVEALRADLEMVILLDDIRNRKSELRTNETFDFDQADATYERAFREFGIDVEILTAEEAAARIRGRSVAAELTAALDDWASVRRLNSDREEGRWRSLFAVARLADPDELRNQLRGALEARDRDALVQMAEQDQVAALPPSTVYLLAKALYDHRQTKQAITLLAKAQHLRPADFWINYLLAYSHAHDQPPGWEDAVRFYTAALTSRPQNVGAHLSLSNALHWKGAFQEAIDFARTAIRLKPDYAEAYIGLGQALRSSGALDEAIAAFREATRLQPENAHAFLQLGVSYAVNKEEVRAIEAYQKAIQLKPDYALAHHNLGMALRRNGQAAEAIAANRQAIRLQPDYEAPCINLGWLLVAGADPQLYEPAVAAELAKQLIARQSNPDNVRNAWNFLGLAHYRLGDGKAAIAAVEKAMELGQGGAGAEWIILALSHAQLGNEEEGRTWYHRAVKSLSEYTPDDQMRRLSTEAAKLLNLPN